MKRTELKRWHGEMYNDLVSQVKEMENLDEDFKRICLNEMERYYMFCRNSMISIRDYIRYLLETFDKAKEENEKNKKALRMTAYGYKVLDRTLDYKVTESILKSIEDKEVINWSNFNSNDKFYTQNGDSYNIKVDNVKKIVVLS